MEGLEKLIEATVLGLREKRDFKGRWCEQYTEGCIEKLRAYAAEGKECGFNCEYCKKFKWVIDRAKHYAEKTGLSWQEILSAWENERGYWYLNYYQDCNQPEIKSDKVRVFETVKELNKSIRDSGFRCPCCNGISKSPYKCSSGIKRSDGKICDWNVNGLLGDLGKGVYVYCKDKVRGEHMFMPVEWEK